MIPRILKYPYTYIYIYTYIQYEYLGLHPQQNVANYMYNISVDLVGGFNHLEKYESHWEGLSNILWKNKTCSKPPTRYNKLLKYACYITWVHVQTDLFKEPQTNKQKLPIDSRCSEIYHLEHEQSSSPNLDICWYMG